MSRRILLSVLLCVLIAPAMAMAQNAGQSDNNRGASDAGGGRRGGGGGNWDPAQIRDRMLSRFKDDLKPTDEEWKVIEPKLSKVMEARFDSGGFGGFRGGRRGGTDTSSADQQRSPVQQASHDLQQALDNKDASADEIAKKLATLREAKEKAKVTLASAQKDLKDVLTQRQEATLVMVGMLD